MSDNVCMMYDVSQILKKAKLTLLRLKVTRILYTYTPVNKMY
jgi:hypothetical protein